MWTIDELVDLFHPNFVGVNNPKVSGVPTRGDAKVVSFQVDEDTEGLFLYVNID